MTASLSERRRPGATRPEPVAPATPACALAGSRDTHARVWNEARVAVVVPAYSEEALIGRTLAGLPGFVDAVIVVDDASPDGTYEAILSVKDERVTVLRHPENRGVGAALATGYLHALEHGADVIVVMAGDNQMDPADLPALLDT